MVDRRKALLQDRGTRAAFTTPYRRDARRGLLPLAALTAMTLAASTLSAQAQSNFDEQAVASFYRGKTLRIVIGSGAGGTFDITARTVARTFGKYVPGNPVVIVENMTGAGGMLAANNLYNTLPRDGTVVGNVTGPILVNQVFGNPGARFDAGKLRYLGGPAPVVHGMVVTKDLGVTKLEELSGSGATRQVKIGSTSHGSAVYNSAYLTKETAGLNFQIVMGYDGFAKIALALEQGEVNASFNSIDELLGFYGDKIESGTWKIIVAVSDRPHPKVPDLPYLGSLIKNPEDLEILRLGVILPLRFAYLYFLPPAVPEDRARALEQAYARTMADPTFLAEMGQAKMLVNPVSGPDMTKMVGEFLNMPEAIKTRLRPVMMPGGPR